MKYIWNFPFVCVGIKWKAQWNSHRRAVQSILWHSTLDLNCRKFRISILFLSFDSSVASHSVVVVCGSCFPVSIQCCCCCFSLSRYALVFGQWILCAISNNNWIRIWIRCVTTSLRSIWNECYTLYTQLVVAHCAVSMRMRLTTKSRTYKIRKEYNLFCSSSVNAWICHSDSQMP